MTEQSRGIRAVRVSVFGLMIAVAPQALAQTHGAAHHAAADAGASAHHDDSEPSFREPQAATAGDVGSGSAPTTANGPVGEVRGSTPDAVESITGPIGPSDVARLMQTQMPRLRPCYEHARATHANLAGRIEVRFTIGRDGHVTQSAAYGMPEAPEVATCVADLLRQTAFPRPENGPLPFIYPLTFAPPPAPVRGHHPAAHPAHPTH